MWIFSLQDVVNVVGGIGVLLPLLEQVCDAEQVYNGGQEISDLLGPELTSPRGPAMLLPLNKSAGRFMFSSALHVRYNTSIFMTGLVPPNDKKQTFFSPIYCSV